MSVAKDVLTKNRWGLQGTYKSVPDDYRTDNIFILSKRIRIILTESDNGKVWRRIIHAIYKYSRKLPVLENIE